MKKIILLLLIVIPIFGCVPTKILKFSQKPDEIIKTDALNDFLSKNKNPKVVLRVPNSPYVVTGAEKDEKYQQDDKDYLYNAIENQLLSSGFIVRDRQLFNQIVGNSENSIDYEKLKNKSDTDLIIELTKLDSKIIFETNKYYDKDDKEKVGSNVYRKYGASVEFKIVLIGSNEFAGIYKFNYTPCIKGCLISGLVRNTPRYSRDIKPYEGVEPNIMEEFIKNATIQLVEEMRK